MADSAAHLQQHQEPSSSTQTKTLPLSAVYTSSTSPEKAQTFTHNLPSFRPQSDSTSPTEAKTKYLLSLRESVITLQSEVNEFLTGKMEEEKSSMSSAGLEKSKGENEVKEEHNYGEEIMDEEG